MELVIMIGIIILLYSFWDYLNDKFPHLYQIVFYGMIAGFIIKFIIDIAK